MGVVVRDHTRSHILMMPWNAGAVGRTAIRRRITRVDADNVVERPDALAVEEPLEIRVNGEPTSVTMRTPGDDIDLALGFLISEGLASPADIRSATNCDDNVVDISLVGETPKRRNFYTTSSCGLCGKDSIDAVRTTTSYDVNQDRAPIDPSVLIRLPDKLRGAQRGFDRTGGLHAAAVFRGDQMLCLREDVGRHNAVDKLIGWAVQHDKLPLTGTVLQVSGRASFELVQKALMAGIPALAAVSAPTSLAAELATESGMTLVGFLRGTSYNIYAGADRLSV
jgi:FdhD protein